MQATIRNRRWTPINADGGVLEELEPRMNTDEHRCFSGMPQKTFSWFVNVAKPNQSHPCSSVFIGGFKLLSAFIGVHRRFRTVAPVAQAMVFGYSGGMPVDDKGC